MAKAVVTTVAWSEVLGRVGARLCFACDASRSLPPTWDLVV